MATSGTYNFSLTNGELIEEAYELAGWEARTAYDAITARRSLGLILAEWANYGVNLWTLENIETTLAESASFSLTARTLDVLEAVIETAANEHLSLERIPIEEYHQLPDKTVQGTPSLFALTRGQSVPTVYLYPVPDIPAGEVWTFNAWQIRYVQDVGTMSQNPEVPARFLLALAYRLAAELALKKRANVTDVELAKIEAQRYIALVTEAARLWERAREADTDHASLHLTPRLRR